MSRLIIVIMESNEYPFGQCDNSHLQKKKVMVRKIVQFHPLNKRNMLLKAKKIKSFTHPFIIKLQQLLEQDFSLHLLFQYVPIKIQTWIQNINPQFIENFRLQLLQLAKYLSENSIVIEFKLKNIGMNQNYSPKYFIGIDYEINNLLEKQYLYKKYETQINSIISPYVLNYFDQTKFKQPSQVNPQLKSQKIDQKLKRQNQRSCKIISNKEPSNKYEQNQSLNSLQRDSMQNMNDLNEDDMKLTFNGRQRPFFQKLPKNISTNIKIENIGKKINQLKSLLRNISTKNGQRRQNSNSKSPAKSLCDNRPDSSHRKNLVCHKQKNPNTPKTQKIDKQIDIQEQQLNGKINIKQLRETQSQSEYSSRLPGSKGLNRINEKKVIQNNSQIKAKNQIRVGSCAKQSYIFQFEKLLNDDIDQFATVETYQNNPFLTKNQLIQKSPRFGITSAPIQIETIKTEPERLSYSYNQKDEKKRKKSIESVASQTSSMQQRVNAVLGVSRRLINNFKKTKVV